MRHTLLFPVLLLGVVGAAALADDKHHPPTGAPAPSAGAAATKPSGGMMPGGMMHTDMMAGGMKPSGMGMMMHRHDGAAALLAPGRIEGRIAYLRAELAPTAAQETEFAGLADALRAAARPAIGGAPHQHGAAATDSASMAERLAAHETATAARLKAVQGLRSAFTQLDAKLTPEQRQAATELLPLLFPDLL